MMHEREKSDPAIVAAKPANETVSAVEEREEPRAGTEGNAGGRSTPRTPSRERVSQGLDRVRTTARERKTERFTALLHHIDVELLRTSFLALSRDAAPGGDGVRWKDYATDLDRNLTDLCNRVHRGAYRAQPSRRVYIPKADGRQRPLAIAALEDKIVQRAAATVLEAIYEEDFLGFSYGFRPKRGPHDALDALAVAIETRNVNHVLDADIQSFFDRVSHEWLMRIVEHRIGDTRMLRLIRKWLKVGVMEDGIVTAGEEGTGQGSVISPLLSNIYLHYVFDLWAEQWRGRHATGDMIIVRYADDIVVGFQHEADARRFRDDMGRRLEEFALTLHPVKTRLVEFGRFAAENRARRGLGKPETFNFLGLTHICGRQRRRRGFRLLRHTRRDRLGAKLRELKEEMRKRMHQPIPEQGKWLRQVVNGFLGYHAVPTNRSAISAFRYHVMDLWHRALRRRSQKDHFTLERMVQLAGHWLPPPKIRHPWPRDRFAAKHPRWEPYALIGPVRFCAGGAR